MISWAWFKAGTALVAAGAVLVVAGCTSTSPDSDHGSSPAPNSAGGSAEPSGEIAESSTLKCGDSFGTKPPARDLEVVAGVVALPTTDFGPVPAGPNVNDDSDTGLFAKQPLTVRSDRSFDLIVPPKERDHLSIGWGNNPMRPTWMLHVSCSDANAKWLTFPGGYFSPRRECASLIVRADGTQHRVRIGVGARCGKS